MRKPIIGIPAKQPVKREDDLCHRLDVVDEHRMMILKHGGIMIMLTPSQETFAFNQTDLGDDTVLSARETEDLHAQVDLCDGIILQGGDFSCAYEVEIARYALAKDMPLMGVCAGFNNILRALGSNTYEDKSGSHSSNSLSYRHPVKIVKGTLLYEILGKEDYAVNSLHTMMASADRVEGYAVIDAFDPDGLVESFHVPDKHFVLATKWHPELMSEDEGAQRIFAAFMAACRENMK